MAFKPITSAAMQTFLARAWPSPLGVVGTLDANGIPHLVPIEYRYDGERTHIWTL